MNNVTCLVDPSIKSVDIVRNGKIIGFVEPDADGEPVINLFQHNETRMIKLSFNDVKIINDNWNHVCESYNQQKKSK